jgi:hypothetical protein
MKTKIITGLLLLVFISSCKKDDNNVLFSKLLGTWVNTSVDQTEVMTDNSFVIMFLPNKMEIYAKGFILNDSNKTWIENGNYSFSLEDSNIVINGNDLSGNVFQMVFDVRTLDDQNIVYNVSEFKINGVSYPDPKTYTNRKVTVDYVDEFLGTWYGKSTTAGTTDTTHHYWNYFADGSFDYYYRDNDGNWINKPDNEGKFFLYGDFLATNYTNDLLSGGTGKAYECWNVNIEGLNMTWTGLRANGQTTSFGLTKVDGPPTSKSLRKP